ncbi:MAG: response regulator, partial [Nitrospirae bacterium]|nr:response regulator [Nitrospirota bacterium]
MTGPTIRRRLLVVEDDEMLQDLYRQLLEILGFDAVTIGRAEE